MKIKTFISSFKYMFSIILAHCRGCAAFELLMRIIRGIMPLFNAYLVKVTTDQLSLRFSDPIKSKPFIYLILITIVAFISRILYEYLQILSTRTTIVASYKASRRIQTVMLEKLKDLDKAYFDNPETFDIIKRTSQFSGYTILNVYRTFMELFRNFPTIVSSVIILMTFEPWIAALSLLTYIPLLWMELSKVKSNNDLTMEISNLERKQTYYSSILQDKNYAKELKIYNYGDFFIKKYVDTKKQIFIKRRKLEIKNKIKDATLNFIKITIKSFVYSYLIYSAMRQHITIGDITLFYTAFTSIDSALYYNATDLAKFAESSIIVSYFNRFIDLKNKIIVKNDNFLNVEKANRGHEIEFKNVWFTYPGASSPVLKGVSFKIKNGESLGIVGLNGAGKTTIVKLLLHLYECDQGEILIDGKNIKEYDPKQYYCCWSVLMQDYNLYALSIKENISLSPEGEIDDKKIKHSAELCCADQWIKNTPLGYKTQLSKRFYHYGYEPSQGQAQKLAFARAFYKDSEFLLLDEPSASIDPKSEFTIFSNIKSILHNKTAVLISHRLTNVMDVDKIIVIKDGIVAEEGNHGQLLSNNGIYANMFKMQAERYQTNSQR